MNRKARRAEARAGKRFRSARQETTPRLPISSSGEFAEALHSQQSGRLAEAVARYDRILSRNPNLAEAHCNRGAALAGLGRFAEAEAAHRRAIALNRDFADAHNNLGIVLCERGRLDEAEASFRRATTLKPDLPKSHSNLGVVLKCRGKFEAAEAAQRTAIALDPESSDLHSNLADVLNCLGRLHDAEQVLRRAISLQPKFAGAFAKLGNTLRDQGRIGEAETACRDAIALDPNHAEAYSNLGNTLADQGRLADAEAAYRRAIALKPNFGEAHNNLGAILKQMGRIDEARSAMEYALRLPPHDALRYLNLGEIRRFTVDDPYLAEMEEFARSIDLLPVKQQIELHFALAKAYDDVGRRADAFQHLLSGNALKRRQLPYEETATVALFGRIREVFTPELTRTLQNAAAEPSPMPVFIIGMPRSGTTLIEQIMASHPQVFGAGELPNFFQAVNDGLAAAGRPLSYPDGLLDEPGERLHRLGARYVSEIAALAPTAARIVNKMPSNFLLAGLIHLALPNAHIIHAVRDPIDTCMSCFSKLFAEGQFFSYDLTELGRYYRRYDALMKHWHGVLPPGRILDVRYEDLVGDFEAQARRIIAHCDLAWDDRCLNFHDTERAVRTASAMQVRQPIYRDAIGRAQPYMQYLEPLLAALSGTDCADADPAN